MSYVAPNATAIKEKSIVINFDLYSERKCELEKIDKIGNVKKILRFIKQIGRCQDNSELHEFLKANNSCDMSNSEYQDLVPEGLKVYEVWHKKGLGMRVFYTRISNVFYPILFLGNH